MPSDSNLQEKTIIKIQPTKIKSTKITTIYTVSIIFGSIDHKTNELSRKINNQIEYKTE